MLDILYISPNVNTTNLFQYLKFDSCFFQFLPFIYSFVGFSWGFCFSNVSAWLWSTISLCLVALSFIFARSRSHSPGRRDRRGHSAERRRDERNRYHPSSSSSLQRRHSKSRWIELLVLRVWVERKCHDSPYSACSLLQLTVIALIRSKNFSVGSELFVPIFFYIIYPPLWGNTPYVDFAMCLLLWDPSVFYFSLRSPPEKEKRSTLSSKNMQTMGSYVSPYSSPRVLSQSASPASSFGQSRYRQ